jgi:hypothetical protein
LILQALHHGAKLQSEELHLEELGISTLISCFVNANRDPKSEAAKPSDFFYFQPKEIDTVRIPPAVANAFFALTDIAKLPPWVVQMAPLDRLTKSRDSSPSPSPVVWIGEGIALILPYISNGVVKFPLGFIEGSTSGSILTSGNYWVKVPKQEACWILDGELAIEKFLVVS